MRGVPFSFYSLTVSISIVNRKNVGQNAIKLRKIFLHRFYHSITRVSFWNIQKSIVLLHISFDSCTEENKSCTRLMSKGTFDTCDVNYYLAWDTFFFLWLLSPILSRRARAGARHVLCKRPTKMGVTCPCNTCLVRTEPSEKHKNQLQRFFTLPLPNMCLELQWQSSIILILRSNFYYYIFIYPLSDYQPPRTRTSSKQPQHPETRDFTPTSGATT